VATDKRLERVLRLGQVLIDSRHGLVAKHYLARSGVKRSALYRDLEVLRAVGFPIRSENGRHWLPADFQLLGRGGLSPDELLALHIARQLAERLPGSRFDRSLSSAWAKVTGGGGQPELLPRGESSLSLSVFPSIDYSAHREQIEILETAIHERNVIALRYRRPSGEISDRDIEPGELHADASVEGLYCIAWCRLRCALRVFAVHRILATSPTGETFVPRAEARSRTLLRNSFRLWIGKDVTTVRLRFAATLAEEISERRWHPSQVLTRTRSGQAIVELAIAEPASLIRWLMGFGAEVEVEEPAWLAKQIQQRHRDAGQMIRAPLKAIAHGLGKARKTSGPSGE
jgi:predicted DNA-binding transcriptional regulator YafY